MLYSNAPAGTLARELKGSALMSNLDRSGAPLGAVAQSVVKSGIFGSEIDPMGVAVNFYLSNQVVGEISNQFDSFEPLPPEHLEFVRYYREIATHITVRMFWYVLIICAREARHNKSQKTDTIDAVTAWVQERYPKVTKTQVEKMFGFTKTFPDSSGALSHLSSSMCAGFELGPFVALLSGLYWKCKWGSAYGGPKWGHITDCLLKFVKGEWTGEIFTDTAFTLAHNTAPIFNKGMLFSYPGDNFIELLDVQRAGMIPQWLASDPEGMNYASSPAVEKARSLMPDLFRGAVNWPEVEALGAVQKYGHKVNYNAPPDGATYIQIDHTMAVKVIDKQRAA